MSLGGRRSAAPAQIAEMFNEVFTSCFTQPTSVFDSVISQEQTYQAEVSTLQFDIVDIFRAIKSLRPDTATGPDGLSATFLKSCTPSIVSHITAIFNASLTTGHVADDWKISRITPIYKIGDASSYTGFFQSCQATFIGQTLQVLGPPCVRLLLFSLGPAVQSPPSYTRKGAILCCKSCDSQMAEGCRAFEDPRQVAIIVMQKEGSESVCL